MFVSTGIYIQGGLKEIFASIWDISDHTGQGNGLPFGMWLFYDLGSRMM